MNSVSITKFKCVYLSYVPYISLNHDIFTYSFTGILDTTILLLISVLTLLIPNFDTCNTTYVNNTYIISRHYLKESVCKTAY